MDADAGRRAAVSGLTRERIEELRWSYRLDTTQQHKPMTTIEVRALLDCALAWRRLEAGLQGAWGDEESFSFTTGLDGSMVVQRAGVMAYGRPTLLDAVSAMLDAAEKGAQGR
jgi:hypothetical protein